MHFLHRTLRYKQVCLHYQLFLDMIKCCIPVLQTVEFQRNSGIVYTG